MKLVIYSALFVLWAMYMTMYEGFPLLIVVIPFVLFLLVLSTKAGARFLWNLLTGNSAAKPRFAPLIVVIIVIGVITFFSRLPTQPPSGEGENEDGLWDSARR